MFYEVKTASSVMTHIDLSRDIYPLDFQGLDVVVDLGPCFKCLHGYVY